MIVLSFFSIFVLGGLVFLFNKIFKKQICPICGGVMLTWLWTLLIYFLGYKINLVLLGLLMGGSVSGLSSKLSEKISNPQKVFLYKFIFIPTGFLTALALINQWWFIFSAGFLVNFILTFVFISNKKELKKTKVEEIKNELKNCC
jgi:hypothetical protein